MSRPAWASTQWAAEDPFARSWEEYAQTLRANPDYVRASHWPNRVNEALIALRRHAGARELYRAAACYVIACELDWRYDMPRSNFALEPRCVTSRTWGEISAAWLTFSGNPRSREFCRLGFIICAPALGRPLDADDIAKALLREFPSDRLILDALVWYGRAPGRPNTWEWRTWVLDQAKRLRALPDARPVDWLALADAYGQRHWVKDTLADAISYRDTLVEWQRRVPPDLAKEMDVAVRGVKKHIKELEGGGR